VYKDGYPRFAALLAANGDFFIFRGFLRLRARLLLSKQDELSMLEQQLDQIDQHETSPLFLGKRRSDRNPERSSALAAIDRVLVEYGEIYDIYSQMILKLIITRFTFGEDKPDDVLQLCSAKGRCKLTKLGRRDWQSK